MPTRIRISQQQKPAIESKNDPSIVELKGKTHLHAREMVLEREIPSEVIVTDHNTTKTHPSKPQSFSSEPSSQQTNLNLNSIADSHSQTDSSVSEDSTFARDVPGQMSTNTQIIPLAIGPSTSSYDATYSRSPNNTVNIGGKPHTDNDSVIKNNNDNERCNVNLSFRTDRSIAGPQLIRGEQGANTFIAQANSRLKSNANVAMGGTSGNSSPTLANPRPGLIPMYSSQNLVYTLLPAILLDIHNVLQNDFSDSQITEHGHVILRRTTNPPPSVYPQQVRPLASTLAHTNNLDDVYEEENINEPSNDTAIETISASSNNDKKVEPSSPNGKTCQVHYANANRRSKLPQTTMNQSGNNSTNQEISSCTCENRSQINNGTHNPSLYQNFLHSRDSSNSHDQQQIALPRPLSILTSPLSSASGNGSLGSNDSKLVSIDDDIIEIENVFEASTKKSLNDSQAYIEMGGSPIGQTKGVLSPSGESKDVDFKRDIFSNATGELSPRDELRKNHTPRQQSHTQVTGNGRKEKSKVVTKVELVAEKNGIKSVPFNSGYENKFVNSAIPDQDNSNLSIERDSRVGNMTLPKPELSPISNSNVPDDQDIVSTPPNIHKTSTVNSQPETGNSTSHTQGILTPQTNEINRYPKLGAAASDEEYDDDDDTVKERKVLVGIAASLSMLLNLVPDTFRLYVMLRQEPEIHSKLGSFLDESLIQLVKIMEYAERFDRKDILNLLMDTYWAENNRSQSKLNINSLESLTSITPNGSNEPVEVIINESEILSHFDSQIQNSDSSSKNFLKPTSKKRVADGSMDITVLEANESLDISNKSTTATEPVEIKGNGPYKSAMDIENSSILNVDSSNRSQVSSENQDNISVSTSNMDIQNQDVEDEDPADITESSLMFLQLTLLDLYVLIEKLQELLITTI